MRKKTTLKDIACFSKGSQINGDLLLDEGKYEYLNGGTKASGTWNEFNVNGKTITISEGGNSCGYVNFMKEKFWCGAHCYYLFDVKCNPKYLYYLLKGNQTNLMKLRSGACMPNIKKSDLGNFKFVYDNDVIHQNKIISIFDDLTNVIDFYEKQIKYFDNLVKARFIEMFGDPLLNPNGHLKEKIEKHINLLSGYPFKSEQYVEKGINICGGLIIMPQKIKWDECVHWSSVEGFEDYLLNENDIVMALDRPWISGGFKIAKVDAEHLPALLIQRTARIRSIDINQDYLYYCFITGGFDKHSNVTGSLVPHISAKDIRSFEIMIPPVELQNQFADFIQQVDKSRFDIKKSITEIEREVVYD